MTPEDLVEIEQIKRLKYRYLRCLDLKLWDELVDVLTPDATAAYSGGAYTFEGRDAILAFLRESMGDERFLSSHRVHHPEIDLTGPDTATGVWALEDTVLIGEHDLFLRGSAFYTDEYVRTAEGWRIAHTGYRRVFEEVHPRASVAGIALTASWWGTDGRSSLAG